MKNKLKKPGNLLAPCKKHDWYRIAVFYSSEQQKCANCGKEREYKREYLP